MIRARLSELDLQPVDELIDARKKLHGGNRGAPLKIDGKRVGAAINKSCILMLSALLQAHVEDVFFYAACDRLRLNHRDDSAKKYRDTYRLWGNPSRRNISSLFDRVGLFNVLEEVRWQKMSNHQVISSLDKLNELRNKIAHGHALPKPISLVYVTSYRNFTEQFASRLSSHVIARLNLRSTPEQGGGEVPATPGRTA